MCTKFEVDRPNGFGENVWKNDKVLTDRGAERQMDEVVIMTSLYLYRHTQVNVK